MFKNIFILFWENWNRGAGLGPATLAHLIVKTPTLSVWSNHNSISVWKLFTRDYTLYRFSDDLIRRVIIITIPLTIEICWWFFLLLCFWVRPKGSSRRNVVSVWEKKNTFDCEQAASASILTTTPERQRADIESLQNRPCFRGGVIGR